MKDIKYPIYGSSPESIVDQINRRFLSISEELDVNHKTVVFGTDGLETVGSDTDITVITTLTTGGGGAIGIRYKTRTLTLTKGLITTVSSESSYTNL